MAQRTRSRAPEKCVFCEQAQEPDYKEVKALRSYVTEKGKILSRSRTGICQKHQRRLSTAVKRARQLALLPYVTVLK